MQSALANADDIAVTATKLRVTFAALSSPHRTAALAALYAGRIQRTGVERTAYLSIKRGQATRSLSPYLPRRERG